MFVFCLNFVICLLLFSFTQLRFHILHTNVPTNYLISICMKLYLLSSFTMAGDNTHIRGLECNQTNSLNYVLNNDVGNGEGSIEIIKHSLYFDNEEFIQFSVDKRNQFTMFSLNIQSINAKFAQLQIFLKKLYDKSCHFDVLCLQETWLNEKSCFSLFDIEDYNFIPQSSLCSAHGGLAFYLHKKYVFKKNTHLCPVRGLGRFIYRNSRTYP